MENGKGMELLAAEIMKTITTASEYDELRPYAKKLGNKLKLTQEVLGFLMPFAAKGDYERYLSDANLFMEFLSYVVISWTWLDMAVSAKQSLLKGDKTYSEEFYESKIHTMKFYFKYELPKTTSLAESLMDREVLTVKTDKEVFV